MASDILNNVGRIVVEKDSYWLMQGLNIPLNKLTDWSGKQQVFKRGDWKLYAKDISQIQDQRTIGLDKIINEAETLILFDKNVGCQIEKDKKRIFCGKDLAEINAV